MDERYMCLNDENTAQTLREIAEMAVSWAPGMASLAWLSYNMMEWRAERVQKAFRDRFSIGDEWEPVPDKGTPEHEQRVETVLRWLVDMENSDPQRFRTLVMT